MKTDTRTAYIALKQQDLEDGTLAMPGEEIPAEIGARLPEQWFTWNYVALKPVTGTLPKAKVRPKAVAPSVSTPQAKPVMKPTHCPTHIDAPSMLYAAEPSGVTTRLHDGREVPTAGYRLWTYCGSGGCSWWSYEDFGFDHIAWENAQVERLGHQPKRRTRPLHTHA